MGMHGNPANAMTSARLQYPLQCLIANRALQVQNRICPMA
jgi:hypothetical protein